MQNQSDNKLDHSWAWFIWNRVIHW